MFKLVSKYKPSGDQLQAIEELVNGIRRGKKAQVLLGATGTGKIFTIANVIERVNKPTLVLARNFGAENLKKTLTDKFNYRLALSATLERHEDEEGTQALLDCFGEKCIEFTLEDAIKGKNGEKFLTPYQYHSIVVYLTNEEEMDMEVNYYE